MTESRSLSILIVDDEEFVRRLLTTLLSAKYRCVSASNANEALAEMETAPFDLVVTDIMMPGITGLELCEKVRKLYPHTQIVIISALADSGNREAARQRGAVGFIEKPFDLSLVQKVVDAALGSA